MELQQRETDSFMFLLIPQKKHLKQENLKHFNKELDHCQKIHIMNYNQKVTEINKKTKLQVFPEIEVDEKTFLGSKSYMVDKPSTSIKSAKSENNHTSNTLWKRK